AILVRDGRIVAVGPAASLPAPVGATVIDLSTRTVLPGLIDCHVHLADRPDRYEDLYSFTDTPFDAAFAAVKHARVTLLAGFTTADSPDEMRKLVREQMKYGVDVIKIAASGGVFSRGDTPGAATFTLAELQAGVEAAHAGGRKVAVHAHGAEAIRRSVLAGVD